MDIDLAATPTADSATTEHGSRRHLLGAGIVGLAASLLPQLSARVNASATTTPGDSTPGSEPAATTTTAPPRRPTDDDTPLLAFAQQAEEAAVMLYDIVLKGKAPGDSVALFATLRDTHQSYAQAVSGFLGRLAPNTAATELVDAMKSRFEATSLQEIASVAYDLESILMVTHQELVGQLIGTNGAALLASILIAEARHATVLADIGGQKDLDTLLLSDAAALEPKKG